MRIRAFKTKAHLDDGVLDVARLRVAGCAFVLMRGFAFHFRRDAGNHVGRNHAAPARRFFEHCRRLHALACAIAAHYAHAWRIPEILRRRDAHSCRAPISRARFRGRGSSTEIERRHWRVSLSSLPTGDIVGASTRRRISGAHQRSPRARRQALTAQLRPSRGVRRNSSRRRLSLFARSR